MFLEGGGQMLRGGPARRRTGLVCVTIFVLSVAPALAQFDRAQIAGVVKDQSGGVIPGATVTVTNVDSRLPRTVVTDGTGFYILTALAPGAYDIEVELPGFKKWTQTGVRLDAAAKLTVDVTLATGVISEAVLVQASSTPLQFDTQNRKTIEAKDFENMALNGRNPINLAMLKAGVRSGNAMNAFLADSLTNGSYNINGSRSDENLITVDGAIATRTRSAGAVIGTINADTVQEVQVLTSNYLPEYGRSSGGQIRFVTKSGGHDFHGSGYDFFRSDKLDANTWSRNASNNPLLAQPAPLSMHQFGGTLGGPVILGQFNRQRDKMFFFWAEEGIRYRAQSTNTGTVPSALMRKGDFSELLDPGNVWFGRAVTIRDPLTQQPFPGNVIPANRLSPNGMALLNAYPLPTAGFVRGNANWIGVSPNPRDTRKDTIRVDYVVSAGNQISARFSHFSWKAVDAFRGTFDLARTDWDRPNTTSAVSWTRSLKSSLLNEFTFGYSLDEVYINVFTDPGLHLRSRYGITYPYIFPGKEIDDKVPTISITNFNEVDGGPYPSSSRGPIYTWSDNLSYLKGRHSFKTGVIFEYSGEDDFDQINVNAQPGDTNNQNGRFEFTDSRANGTGVAVANAAMGLFTNYGEIGKRSLTKWRALAMDAYAQDSWKPADRLTVEGGVRYVLWPPWYALLNNAAMFNPAFYDPARAAQVDPTGGFILSGDPYNGVVLPGSGFPADATGVVSAASNSDLQRLFHNLPRGFSETHKNVFEPRIGASYALTDKTIARAGFGVFHNRTTLNDSTLLGGNPPIQLKVGVTNGLADSPSGTQARTFPLVMTMQDPVFDHPMAYDFSAGVQRELPYSTVVDVTYVNRLGRNLQRERNLNQLQPGTLQANPGINPQALRPYLGFGAIRLSENAGKSTYNGLQVSLDRRYRNGLKIGVAYTLSRLKDDASDKRNILFNAYDAGSYWAISDNDRTHLFNFHYIYELPFWREQQTTASKLLGGWQISGATVFQSGRPLSIWLNDDRAGVGDTTNQPWNLVGDTAVSNPGFSLGPAVDQTFWFNPTAFSRPAAGTFGNAGRNPVRGPGYQSWDLALLKNFGAPTGLRAQFRAEMFNFPNIVNLNDPETSPTSGSFGRITGKGSTANGRPGERNIQLSLKFLF
jgi:Carboxypeptidase regulatory-like domain